MPKLVAMFLRHWFRSIATDGHSSAHLLQHSRPGSRHNPNLTRIEVLGMAGPRKFRSQMASPAAGDDVAPLLRHIKPSGWLGVATGLAVGVPMWTITALKVLLERIAYGPGPTKDRTGIKLPPPLPVEETWVQVQDGVKLHVVSPGRKPDKPLLLMVHGFPEFWYSWRHQMEEFKDAYDVVAFDMRGYNVSDKPKDLASYSMDRLIADIPALVKGLGHKSCILVAHDWGGSIAWLAAAAHPDVVQRLIIIAAPHLGLFQVNLQKPRLATLKQLMKSWYILLFQVPYLPEYMFARNDYREITEVFTSKQGMGVQDPAAISAADVEQFKTACAQPGALTSSINYYRAGMRHLTAWPIPEVWELMKRRIRIPVLVLWADHDMALDPMLMDGVEEVAPHVELHVLEGCSHWIQQDRPTVVNGLMRSFLAKTAADQ